MYCSACGVAVAQGVSYCNYCGTKLGADKGESDSASAEVRPELLVCAMTGLFILGLVAISILMRVMKTALELNAGQIFAVTLLSFLMMLLIEGVFVRLLLRRKRGTEEAGDNAVRLKGPATKELDAAQARALPEPLPSVTEQTTRTLEPVYTERTSK